MLGEDVLCEPSWREHMRRKPAVDSSRFCLGPSPFDPAVHPSCVTVINLSHESDCKLGPSRESSNVNVGAS